MKLPFKATHVVLALLCVMYFITYVDRVTSAQPRARSSVSSA